MWPKFIAVLTWTILTIAGRVENVHLERNNVANDKMEDFGVIFEELSAPIFYDNFVPIVYNFEIPNWSISVANLASLAEQLKYKSSDCSTLSTAQEDLTLIFCKNITRAAHEVHSQIVSLVKQSEPIFYSLKNSKVKETKEHQALEQLMKMNRLNELQFSCADINPHFSDLPLPPQTFENYLNNLKFCSYTNIVITKSFKSKDKISSVISKRLSSLLIDSSGKTQPDLNKSSIFQNFISSYETSLIAEMNLWNSAVYTCQSNLIPSTLVPKEILMGSLVKTNALLQNGLNLSIPIDALNMERYYKHKLADCVFLTNGTFAVRILVPVVNTQANYFLKKYYTIPFLQKNNNQNKNYSVCELANVGRHYIEDSQTNRILFKSLCRANELCKVPDVTEHPSTTSTFCLSSILRNSNSSHQYDESLKKSCPLKCDSMDSDLIPFTQRKGASRFVVLGDASTNVTIQCGSSSNSLKKQTVQLHDNATLLISLPCSCSILQSPTNEILRSYFPCEQDASLLRLKFVKNIYSFEGPAPITVPSTKNKSVSAMAEENTISPLKRDILYSKYISLEKKFKELSHSCLLLNETFQQGMSKILEKVTDTDTFPFQSQLISDSLNNHSLYYNVLAQFSTNPIYFSNLLCLILMGLITLIVATLGTLIYFVFRLYRWKQVEPFKTDRAPVYNPTMATTDKQ